MSAASSLLKSALFVLSATSVLAVPPSPPGRPGAGVRRHAPEERFLTAIGEVRVLESGVFRGVFGSYAAGDVLRVSIHGGLIRYIKNGHVFYTSTVTPIHPLHVDTSFFTPGAALGGVALVDLGTGN